MDTSTSPRQRDVRKYMILNCACWPSRRIRDLRGALKASLLIAMTEFLCFWEERRVPAEHSCERGAAFLVLSAYESPGKDAILLTIQCFATLRESTDWYHLDTVQKLELFSHCTFSPAGFKSTKISLRQAGWHRLIDWLKISLCNHSVQACCSILLASQLQACYLHLSMY